jgi:hypothetical protein
MAQQRGAVDGSPGVLSFLKRPRRFAWGSFVSGGDKFDSCGGRKSDSRQHGLAAG